MKPERMTRKPPVAGRVNASDAVPLDGSERIARLNPLEHPVCLSVPRRLSWVTSWQQHVPFAMFLIDLVRPGLLVA